MFLNKLDYTCVYNCPDGYYAHSTLRTCEPCDAKCDKCVTKSDNCTECKSGYYLFSNFTCLTNCPIYYWNNAALKNCTDCDLSCDYCLNSSNLYCSVNL